MLLQSIGMKRKEEGSCRLWWCGKSGGKLFVIAFYSKQCMEGQGGEGISDKKW